MIAGIGVDIVDVARIQAMLDRYGERFLRRVYTEAETRLRDGRREQGGAAGGAVRGEGSGDEGARDGEIAGDPVAGRRDAAGALGKARGPSARAGGEMGEDRGVGGAVHVSITHDGGKAVAFVIIEKAGGE